MKTEHINELITHPEKVSAEDLTGLRQLVQDYPWCQSFQILYAKALKLDDDPTFNKQLKKTAVYATDRKVLYRLIMQPGLQKSIADFETLVAEPENEPAKSEQKEDKTSQSETPQTEIPPATSEPLPSEKDDQDEQEEPVIEEVQETIATEETSDSQSTSDGESTDGDDDPIDSRNLEQEVLKEVAARAYQLEFESETISAQEAEEDKETEQQPAETEPPNQARPLTFLDFITGKTSATASPETPPEKTEDAQEEISLIDRFIKNEPKIERKKSSFFSPVNMGKMSLVDNDEMVSETLAAIYAKQGDVEKAKKAYRQLALKYPEKSIYFAGLIKKLERSGK